MQAFLGARGLGLGLFLQALFGAHGLETQGQRTRITVVGVRLGGEGNQGKGAKEGSTAVRNEEEGGGRG